MFTRLDAAYNRCRPVPPWNGSSSASRLRKATTRCWKGYRREKREAGTGLAGIGAPGIDVAGIGVARIGVARSAVLFAGAILLVPALLFPQQPTLPDPVRALAT